MRALTLKPHWAHAVAHLGKRCENRKRPIPQGFVGERVAIHAGATLPKRWNVDLWCAHPWSEALVWRPCAEHGVDIAHGSGEWKVLATRAIVATAVLGVDVKAAPGRWAAPGTWTGWGDAKAAYWWRLDDVRTLVEPVPFPKPNRGQLGLWRLWPILAEAVQAAEWRAA